MERIFDGVWVDCNQSDFDWYDKMTDEQVEAFEERCDTYHGKYVCDDARLRAIMLNVIRNNGEFILPKRIRNSC